MRNQELPGSEIIQRGIADLRAQRETVPALLVAIAWTKLRKFIADLPSHSFRDPDLRLYQLLARENSDSAHSRYNALIRRLVSFERAIACVS